MVSSLLRTLLYIGFSLVMKLLLDYNFRVFFTPLFNGVYLFVLNAKVKQIAFTNTKTVILFRIHLRTFYEDF